MADSDLRFELPAGGADLVFGAAGAPGGTVDGTVAIAFAPLAAAIVCLPTVPAQVAVALPALTAAVVAEYDLAVARPTIGRASTPWQVGRQARAGAVCACQDAAAACGRHEAGWRLATPASARARAGHASAIGVRAMGASPWTQARGVAAWGAAYGHQDAVRARRGSGARHQDAVRVGARTSALRHQDAYRDRRRSARGRWRQGGRIERGCGHRLSAGVRAFAGRAGRWQEAMRTPTGVSLVPPPPPPGPQPQPCYSPSPALVFWDVDQTSAALVFVCDRVWRTHERVPVIVPIKRVYTVINTVSLHRATDNAAIEATRFELGFADGDFTWTWGATVAVSALALFEPVNGLPVEIVATVNGAQFRLLAEEITRERTFGSRSLRIGGRGLAALLAAPYAPVLQVDNGAGQRTAQQLCGDVLTLNGVGIGWTVDWSLTDWLVPAGVFVHRGTWIEGVSRIASAAGGTVRAARAAQTLRVAHRYPVAPWDWAAAVPDVILPADVAVTEGMRWLDKPAYNAVYVSGESTGVLGHVKRAGTAGGLVAPMVTDALITDAQAARQRGLAVLADTGRQVEVTVRIPVLDPAGVIEPGTLLRYNDGHVTRTGVVRSTRIEATMPAMSQTLGVECHA